MDFELFDDGTTALKGKGKRPENNGGKTSGKQPAENETKSSGGGRKKKQKVRKENENKLIDLLEAQHEAFKRSQEQDEKAMETAKIPNRCRKEASGFSACNVWKTGRHVLI